MRIVLQNVMTASVKIDERNVAEIKNGYLLFVGMGASDTEKTVDKMLEKINKLRIFKDKDGKTNLSLADTDGSVLVVSQFTLYADCKKGNRPSFTSAAQPEKARELYEYFLEKSRQIFSNVECGEFGADMKVSLINDGPFTLMLDSETLFGAEVI